MKPVSAALPAAPVPPGALALELGGATALRAGVCSGPPGWRGRGVALLRLAPAREPTACGR
jgi:hypothetical protein